MDSQVKFCLSENSFILSQVFGFGFPLFFFFLFGRLNGNTYYSTNYGYVNFASHMRLHQQATVPPIIPPKTQNPKAPKPEPYPKKKKKDLKGSQRAEAQ